MIMAHDGRNIMVRYKRNIIIIFKETCHMILLRENLEIIFWHCLLVWKEKRGDWPLQFAVLRRKRAFFLKATVFEIRGGSKESNLVEEGNDGSWAGSCDFSFDYVFNWLAKLQVSDSRKIQNLCMHLDFLFCVGATYERRNVRPERSIFCLIPYL